MTELVGRLVEPPTHEVSFLERHTVDIAVDIAVDILTAGSSAISLERHTVDIAVDIAVEIAVDIAVELLLILLLIFSLRVVPPFHLNVTLLICC